MNSLTFGLGCDKMGVLTATKHGRNLTAEELLFCTTTDVCCGQPEW